VPLPRDGRADGYYGANEQKKWQDKKGKTRKYGMLMYGMLCDVCSVDQFTLTYYHLSSVGAGITTVIIIQPDYFQAFFSFWLMSFFFLVVCRV